MGTGTRDRRRLDGLGGAGRASIAHDGYTAAGDTVRGTVSVTNRGRHAGPVGADGHGCGRAVEGERDVYNIAIQYGGLVGKQLLEVGCSDGWNLLTAVDRGAYVWGVDASAALGMSRTPFREAMYRLEQEGLELRHAAAARIHDLRLDAVMRQHAARGAEEVLQELRAPGQERVRVTALRGAAAVLRCGGEVVLLQDDHLVETVGEDAGGDEAGVAAADDEGALVPLRRHGRHAG